MIFWSIVVPIITFACELWILDDDDVKLKLTQGVEFRGLDKVHHVQQATWG